MSDHGKRTLEERLITGNDVFEKVARALALDAISSRKCLSEVLRVIGSSPQEATIEEIGASLPEIERRVRLLVREDIADHTMRRLRRLLLTWDG